MSEKRKSWRKQFVPSEGAVISVVQAKDYKFKNEKKYGGVQLNRSHA